MKKSFNILVAASAVVVLLAACAKEVESVPTDDNNGPVYITVSIDPETKSTLNDGTGAFAFSSGDAIMVCNESGAFSGTTTSTENSGTFVMEAGFNGSTSGYAGFPASMVTDITKSSVTFTLPINYDYDDVGGANADAAKVPCPMIGSYDGSTKKVTLLQAGSLVRFRVTNIAAGSLSFIFPTNVTGRVKLTTIPSGTEDGILASNFVAVIPAPGKTITISGVPEVTSGNYIYITLPVPTGTVPENILVTNTPDNPESRIRIQSLTPEGAVALKRAGGRKVGGVSPTEISIPSFTINPSGDQVVLAPGNLMARIGSYVTSGPDVEPCYGYATSVSEWKFGDYFQCIGDATNAGNYLFSHYSTDCEGKWVDLFSFQGASTPAEHAVHGLVMTNINYTGLSDDEMNAFRASWYGGAAGENAYAASWRTDVNNTSTPSDEKIYISNGGDYTWRPMTATEVDYLFSGRTGATVSDFDEARSGRATVNGVKGILVFPDEVIWNNTDQGGSDNFGSQALNDAMTAIADAKGVAFEDWGSHIDVGKDTYDFEISFSSSDFVTMSQCGIVFLPTSGTLSNKAVNSVGSSCQLVTTSSPDNDNFRDVYFFSSHKNGVYSMSSGSQRGYGRAVRLVRDVPKP